MALKTWDDVSPSLEDALLQATKPDIKNLWYNRFAVNYMSPLVGEDGIWLAEVKGNFKHRLQLCGVGEESPHLDLTEVQQTLRNIAEKQYGTGANPGWRKKDNGCYAGPERPPWSNGCQCYLKPEHRAALQKMVLKHKIKLMSKHIVVSNEMMPTVVAAFARQPEDHRVARDLYLLKRITFSVLVWCPAPEYIPQQVDLSALPAH